MSQDVSGLDLGLGGLANSPMPRPRNGDMSRGSARLKNRQSLEEGRPTLALLIVGTIFHLGGIVVLLGVCVEANVAVLCACCVYWFHPGDYEAGDVAERDRPKGRGCRCRSKQTASLQFKVRVFHCFSSPPARNRPVLYRGTCLF